MNEDRRLIEEATYYGERGYIAAMSFRKMWQNNRACGIIPKVHPEDTFRALQAYFPERSFSPRTLADARWALNHKCSLNEIIRRNGDPMIFSWIFGYWEYLELVRQSAHKAPLTFRP